MKEIIFTAVLSSLLTVSGSFFLMKSQLTSEQDYWLDRQKHDREAKALDNKVKLLESFNDSFLKLNVLTTKTKIALSTFQANLHICEEAIKLEAKDFKCEAKAEDYLKLIFEYREQSHKLSVVLQMLPIYFGEEVSSLIVPLNDLINSNYQKITHSQTEDKNKQELELSDYYKREFSSIPGFMDARNNLIKAMLNDISNTKSKLFHK